MEISRPTNILDLSSNSGFEIYHVIPQTAKANITKINSKERPKSQALIDTTKCIDRSDINSEEQKRKENTSRFLLIDEMKPEIPIIHRKNWQIGLLNKQYKKLKFYYKENLVIKLDELGFDRETIQNAVLFTNSYRLEEVLRYIVKSEDGFWEHKFIRKEYMIKRIDDEKLCSLCVPTQFKTDRTNIDVNDNTYDSKIAPISDEFVFTKNGIVFSNQLYKDKLKYKAVSEAITNKDIFL